jgi:hypothetical protein
MSAVQSHPPQPIQYPPRTVERAARAVRCAPFEMTLYLTLQDRSVSINEIAGETGTRNRYTRTARSESAAESELMWLIQVGLLRREVDGQGITDSFRLTPLGRQLIARWNHNDPLIPTGSDRFYNAMSRWLRLPL